MERETIDVGVLSAVAEKYGVEMKIVVEMACGERDVLLEVSCGGFRMFHDLSKSPIWYGDVLEMAQKYI